ncbi:MAG: hypothetical protein KatS3mg015_3246 [Fimbriimonadales bacterium]|nr:MAG: hypothetical protein KatS3mg015_3246 [Fimbriimonadales bacterium]
MRAVKRLRAMTYPSDAYAVFRLLVELCAVVEAAQVVIETKATGELPDLQPLVDALAALDDALEKREWE